MRNCGELPMKGANEIDRVAVAEKYGFTLPEVNKAAWVFKAMYVRQPESTITFSGYLDAMKDAGLRPEMIGKQMGKWQFARVGDKGPYSQGNARFVPAIENQRERDMGYMANEATRKALSIQALMRPKQKCKRCGGEFSPGMFARWHGDRCRDDG